MPDAGVTLTELVVAMTVFGIILMGVATLTAGIHRSDGAARDRVDDTAEGSYALEQIDRAVTRAAVPTTLGGRERAAFAEAGPGTMVLYADLDDPGGAAGPSRVELVLADGVLSQTVRRPVEGTRDTYCADDDGSPACDGRVRTLVLARAVRNDGTEPLFTYLDAEGAVTDEPHRVRAVEVALVVQQDPSTGGAPTRFAARVVPYGLVR
ncbi:PulJ/GspJ family protein [Cellulomonas pakistanensis]|uniref:Prepilin-type N-terminal cleavage/methylation domain-containing protein n=1 Tax=Cellulomonas pakistanensis TaxID=992287 RepID=A0A919U367_9CELL|nr:prepilin-type N-terminal cleavage/methylation domain-containing protein [Cellulomonas pakistanensis]GIG36863.1 hypothetical protein Cpa01nite_22440 [Cellulomonas pakistanensis]